MTDPFYDLLLFLLFGAADCSVPAPMEDAPRDVFDARARKTVAGWVADAQQAARINAWGEASDQRTVARAMGEYWAADLRNALADLQVPVMLIAAPAGPSRTPREQMLHSYEAQFAHAPKHLVSMRFAATARHFIMIDEPEWMWAQMDECVARW